MKDFEALERLRLDLQDRLDGAKSKAERNRLGQFSTPPRLALELVCWALGYLSSQGSIRFLDPAFGTGAFYAALLQVLPLSRINTAVGYEIDPHYGIPSLNLWDGTPLSVRLADFTRTDAPTNEASKFNLVICNPPYVRHHHIAKVDKLRLKRTSEVAIGLQIDGLAGLYCYFLTIAHSWMAKDAIAGWLIPSEFMDVNYGIAIKQYLVHQVSLIRIHRFDPLVAQFDDALVSSTIVLFKNEIPQPDHKFQFTFGGSIETPRYSRDIILSTLSENKKWSRLPINEISQSSLGPTLGDFFTIKRGIATGDNHFFIMTNSQIERRDLPLECFVPILPSPRYLASDEICADANGLPTIAPKLFLLSCDLPEHVVRVQYSKLYDYLQTGKPSVSDRYLCKSRRPWYAQENRASSPFICTYMGRSGKNGRPIRFILNQSRATVANVYLLLYPKAEIARAISCDSSLARKIWQALNQIHPTTVITEGRIYGGGLYKMEPSELANVPADPVAELLASESLRMREQMNLFDTR